MLTNIMNRQFCQAACLKASDLPCRSAVYNYQDKTCKLMAETRRSERDSFKFVSQDIEFLENQCAPDPPNCEYTNYEERFLPYFDRFFRNVFDTNECQSYCERESDFTCRSYNYHAERRECSLSSDDTSTAGGVTALIVNRDYFYADKALCRNVRVDCTSSSMLVTFTFGTPFEGRVYAQGNPQVCFEMGSREIELMLRIPLDTTCDKQVSFAPQPGPGRTGGGIDINNSLRPPNGVSDVVRNTAPTPNVVMNIYKSSGSKANTVELGELLELRIEMIEASAFGIFARNLEARTEFGELMTLIDNVGCPRYPDIFPALMIDEQDKSLVARFKAFRFPSTGKVNFVATIRFCQDLCNPVNCGGGVFSYGQKDAEEGQDEPSSSSEASELEWTSSSSFSSSSLSSTPTSSSSELSTASSESSSSTSTASPSVSDSSTSTVSTKSSSDASKRDFEEPEAQLPNDIPIALSLIVGSEEPMYDNFASVSHRRESYIREDYICSPTSSVIAAVIVLLVLLFATVVAFAFFYRSKKRLWKKESDCDFLNAYV
ncbi:hypothetical protein Anas_12965 [Armadillidium nasatum]|uniref:Uncharacterized protein n=1 Tax=Armadillidium nasatum TaxID=96803 RepID=A0A5N5T7K2_9CRUS|nr:hypothetical protein Anas_12965 [Armadillidium nasatum]